jgi:uncharacterized protein YacL
MDYILLLLVIIIALEMQFLVFRNTGRRSAKGRRVFVDTSALMDGRIVLAATTGFIPGRLVVPTSVLKEMQMLADSADSEKRMRARRGLDAVSELQALATTSVEVLDDGAVGVDGVDGRLVELARKHSGWICTIDYNLNKVAKAENIFVINVNELAQSIRMAYLPGEKVTLEPTAKGQDSHQAVSYLADGTMVVIEQGAPFIGKSVEVEFTRSIQTAAGRMLFAKAARVPSKQSAKSVQTENAKPHDKNVRQPAPNRPTNGKPANRGGRKKRSSEDNLIDLVDKQ